MTISEIYDSILTKIKSLKTSLDLFEKNSSNNKNEQELKTSLTQYSNDIDLLKSDLNSKKSSGLLDLNTFNDLNSLVSQIEAQFILVRANIVKLSGDLIQMELFIEELKEGLKNISNNISEISNSFSSINLSNVTEETSIKIKSIKSHFVQIKSELSEYSMELIKFSEIINSTDLLLYTQTINQLNSIIDSMILTIDSSLSIFVSGVLNFKREIEENSEEQENNPTVLKWKTSKLSDVFNTKDLKKINEALKKTQDFFKNIDSLLSQAQEFVEIIKQIESLIEDPLTVLINQLAKQLKSFIDQFKSLGIYVLDMIEYAYIGETRIPNEIKGQIYNIENSKYKEYIQQNYLVNNEVLSSYDADSRANINGGVVDSKSLYKNDERIKQLQSKRNLGKLELSDSEKSEYDSLDGNKPEDLKKLNEYNLRITESKELNKLLSEPKDFLQYLYRFKAFTYEEWIEVIAESFLDNFDLPDGALVNGTRMNRLIGRTSVTPSSVTGFDEAPKANVGKFKEVFGKNLDENESYAYSKLYGDSFKADNLKSGRPQFAKGSISKVVIFMISAPDINGFITNYQLLSKLFSFHDPAGLSADNRKISFERWKNENKDLSDLFPIADFVKGGRSWDDFIDNVNYKNRINSIIQSGSDPDFYGVSLYSLMPELFNNMESILYFLNNYYNDIPPLFGDQFDSLIKLVKDKIQILKNFSKQLEEIISYFNDLMNTSLNILTVESNSGNEDIYDKLISAKEAPGQDSGRRMFYGGYVFAFGTPDPSKLTESLDIDKIIKETSIEFDEKSRELKEVATDQFNAFDKIIKGFK